MRTDITDEYLYRIMPKVAELMIADIPDNPEMPFEPSKEFEKKMKKLIRKSKHPKRYKLWNQKFTIVAVLVIAIVGAGAALVASVQANEELRMWIKERIVMEDGVMEYFEVSGKGTMKRLTYIPEGYELVKEDESVYLAEYENESGIGFIFNAWIIDEGTMIFRDTEYVNKETLYINGNEISLGYKDSGMKKAEWYEDNMYYLIIFDDEDNDEIIKMIENME